MVDDNIFHSNTPLVTFNVVILNTPLERTWLWCLVTVVSLWTRVCFLRNYSVVEHFPEMSIWWSIENPARRVTLFGQFHVLDRTIDMTGPTALYAPVHSYLSFDLTFSLTKVNHNNHITDNCCHRRTLQTSRAATTLTLAESQS